MSDDTRRELREVQEHFRLPSIGLVEETRQYLRDFNRLNDATATARELYDAMLEIYPDRVNPGSLWGAANIAKKPASARSRE